MLRLSLGILLWSLVHFVPAAFTEIRSSLISKLGENPYKGLFTLLMALSIYLLISGWKAAVPESMYMPPSWGRHAASLLVLVAFVLFIAPYPPTNIKRILRHPQLTGVACWGAAHLLANGESKSILLFGGLTVWAIVEMVLLNRRDGPREKPDPAPLRNDVILVIGGLVTYVVVAMAHQWLFGVSPFTQNT